MFGYTSRQQDIIEWYNAFYLDDYIIHMNILPGIMKVLRNGTRLILFRWQYNTLNTLPGIIKALWNGTNYILF